MSRHAADVWRRSLPINLNSRVRHPGPSLYGRRLDTSIGRDASIRQRPDSVYGASVNEATRLNGQVAFAADPVHSTVDTEDSRVALLAVFHRITGLPSLLDHTNGEYAYRVSDDYTNVFNDGLVTRII